MYPVLDYNLRAKHTSTMNVAFVYYHLRDDMLLLSFFCQSVTPRREDDPSEDRSTDSVFINTTKVVQSVIGLNNGLLFARWEDYPAFVKVRTIELTGS